MNRERNQNEQNPSLTEAPVPGSSPERQLEQLLALQQISYFIDSEMELSDILDKIVEVTAQLMSADVCSIFLLDEDAKSLVLRATRGLDQTLIDTASLELGEGIPGWVAKHREILALADVSTDPRFKPLGACDNRNYHAFLCGPLSIRQELVGVMNVRKKERYDFSPAEITIFETICKQISTVIEKSRLYFNMIENERMAAIGLSLSEISHYIKNVLSNIQSGLYLVESGLQSGDLERALQAWTIVKKSNRKIADLVQNMLSYSRTTQPKMEQDNLNLLVNDILETATRAAQERAAILSTNLAPDLPDVIFDYDQLYNSLLNLVGNALDSIPPGCEGQVEIVTTWDKERGEAVLSVSDNGAGISDEDRRKIFQLFYSTKGSRGTGIGLAVTKKIIEEHGGRISFESVEGEGATFTVRLPLYLKVKDEG